MTRNLPITAIELEGFQCFEKSTRIEFAPITLLYGPNSAGKVQFSMHWISSQSSGILMTKIIRKSTRSLIVGRGKQTGLRKKTVALFE